MTAFVYILIGWIVLAGAVAVWMGRRGHASFTWAFVVGVFGPLSLPLVISAIRRERVSDHTARVVRSGEAGSGSFDVVIGVDGSTAGIAALDFALSLLGPQLRRLCLATVIEYDQDGIGPRSVTEDALATLEAVVARVQPAPALVILKGRPAQSLAAYAAQERFDLIAVGARGEGNSAALLGSVADHLIRTSTVPVLLGGVSDRVEDHQFITVVDVAAALGARA